MYPSRLCVSVCSPSPLKSPHPWLSQHVYCRPGGLTDSDTAVAQALADVASIAIIQDEATRNSAIREGELNHALNSCIAIEQAKGMIAEHNTLNMDEAFTHLRTYARSNNRGLTEVATALVDGGITVRAVSIARQTPAPPAGT